jgi:hypothetical protein
MQGSVVLVPLVSTPCSWLFSLADSILKLIRVRPGRGGVLGPARAGAWLAVALVLGSWPAPASGAAERRSRPAQVLRSQESGVTFRVDVREPRLVASAALAGCERIEIDGYQRRGEPGSPPTLSRQFLVALPPEGSFRVTHRVLASKPLGTHRLEPVPQTVLIPDDEMGPLPSERVVWDETVYRAHIEAPLVETDPDAYIRHQRVLPVWVNPVRYDPVTEELVVATAIEVEVVFVTPRSKPGVGLSPAREAKGWDEVFGRLLVNAEQAKAWRRSRAVTPAAPLERAAVVPGAVKIRVRETGMHSVTASALIASGFPPGQQTTNLHLFHRGYDEAAFAASTQEIAFDVVENTGGAAGVFDGSDRLIFHGRRLRDDPIQGDPREQFSAYNVYWLEPAPGTRMGSRTPGAGFVSPDTATASFPVAAAHFETDLIFRDGTPVGINDIYYYNFGAESSALDMPFTVHAVRPGTNATLSAELHGQTYASPRTLRLSLANSLGEQVLDAAYPLPSKQRRVFTATIPAANLTPGVNQFRMNRPDDSRTTLQAHLNWVEITYQSLYRALGNTLRFNSASLSGDTSITVTGLTSTSGFEMFDVTDPALPVRVSLGAGHFQAVSGGFALSFRETFSGRREFVLVPSARMIPVAGADIVADVPGSIIGNSAETDGVDVLVVSHATFVPTMRQWASYRRAQGYRVLLVDVEDVFDEFDGGVPSARSIYRFTRHFFTRGGAGTLLLVGDSSEDHKHIHTDSGFNFVPTYTRIDNVSSLQLDEVVTSDKKFVKLPGPGGSIDVYPDLEVGRLPVGDVGELDTILNKVYAFEAPAASDFWRRRMIIIADDEYSEGGSTFGGFQFCDNNEAAFEAGQENTAQIIERSLSAGYEMVRFYLRSHTTPFYTAQCANRFAAITFTRNNVTEILMNELSQGATLVTIQAHMNRSVVTHERLLTTVPATILGGETGKDHLRTDNRHRPWIIFGMGCHFSEYAIHRELGPGRLQDNSPNGDAFAEQYLFQNERGAVGTYGSSGFEYLNQTNAFMNTMASIWFYEAPYDTMLNQTKAEWKFGELMFLVETQMAGAQRDPVERYHILGDPLLRIDAGPPAFEVTVDGRPARSGDIVQSGGEGDTIQVVAVVTDENAIRDFSLEIAGVDLSDSLSIVPLSDPGLPRARQYRVSFRHKLRPETYDIVLRAFQAPDTLAGTYHMEAEFRLKVEATIRVTVNGRPVDSGDAVPVEGSYRIDLAFPVVVSPAEVVVTVDDVAPADLSVFRPDPDDSLALAATFHQALGAGRHDLRVAAGAVEFNYVLVVSAQPGLHDLVNYPNPFRGAGTSFVYTNDAEILEGTIDIFTVSGKRVRSLEIPGNARLPGQNAVFWDGRDSGGGAIGNGVYLYVVRANQRGGSVTQRGKMSKIE